MKFIKDYTLFEEEIDKRIAQNITSAQNALIEKYIKFVVNKLLSGKERGTTISEKEYDEVIQSFSEYAEVQKLISETDKDQYVLNEIEKQLHLKGRTMYYNNREIKKQKGQD